MTNTTRNAIGKAMHRGHPNFIDHLPLGSGSATVDQLNIRSRAPGTTHGTARGLREPSPLKPRVDEKAGQLF